MKKYELLCFWNYEKNDTNPATDKLKSKEKYHWKCKVGHEWIERLDHRKQKATICKICEKIKVLDENLLSEWDYNSSLNKDLDPHSLICNAKQRIGWKCYRGHEWEARLDHRQSSKSNCPYCSGHKIIEDKTSLGAMFPELLEEWDYGKNSISPFQVAAKTIETYWWKCKSNHKWSASVANRTRRGDSCPYCNKSRASGEYNLTTEYPGIIDLWHYEQNLKKPEEYLPFSNDKVIFKCQFGHSWQDKISAVVSGNRCEVCYPRHEYQPVSEKYNLAHISPELAKEYDNKKNVMLASVVSPYSGKKVWWICSLCSYEWEATVDNRQRGKKCPKCSNWTGTSFSEQAIYYYLRQAHREVKSRYKFNVKDETIEIDIFFKALKVAIEYDGYYYHLDKAELDEKKNHLLNESGIKVIRVRESNGHKKKLPELKGDFYKIDHDGSNLVNLNATIKQLLVLIKDITEEDYGSNEIDISKDGMKIKELYRKDKSSKSLAKKNVTAEAQWDYEKNGDLSPHDVYPSDTTEVFWHCKVCDNKWSQRIVIRNRDSKCPYCTGARVNSENSFAAVQPNLLKYWDYGKNDIDPAETKCNVKAVCFFKCDNCKAEWNEAIRNLIRRKKICKTCGR